MLGQGVVSHLIFFHLIHDLARLGLRLAFDDMAVPGLDVFQGVAQLVGRLGGDLAVDLLVFFELAVEVPPPFAGLEVHAVLELGVEVGQVEVDDNVDNSAGVAALLDMVGGPDVGPGVGLIGLGTFVQRRVAFEVRDDACRLGAVHHVVFGGHRTHHIRPGRDGREDQGTGQNSRKKPSKTVGM